MGRNKTERDPYKMRVSQMIGWSGRGISGGVSYVVLAYITFYGTNIMGLPAALVGTLLLASKLFDGVTDLIAGVIIDRTETKWGKARPYELCVIGQWLATILMFSCPSLGTTGKAIWLFVTYTATNSIFLTLLNASDAVYLRRAFRYENDRSKALSFQGLVIQIFATILSIAFPIMMGTLGTRPGGWTTMLLITGIPMMIIGMMRFLLVKEVDVDEEEKKLPPTRLKDCLPVFKDKYIYIILGVTLLNGMASNITTAVGTYYFTYVVGDITLMSTLGIVSMVTPLFLLIMPMLLRKLSLQRLYIVSFILTAAGYVLRAVAGASVPMLMVGNLVTTLGVMPCSYYTALLLINLMSYNEMKNGTKVEGVISAVNGFAGKVAGGLASGIVGIVMGMCGFDGNLAVQSSSAMGSIIGFYGWIPAAFYIIMAVLMGLFDLDKKMAALKNGGNNEV